ncbi:MBL fold metallo-hydrolase [Szabonella alba]|uniref:MBL fold metallo-hydrolase n=1 Tax=Szabonella alba TaxID=2804194 RepID=A0A8K0Y1X0_9RHOB|nr:MBL fold metallo-hydrolase [Szabonella alba]MBL4916504.1 MBL fold metallo-hydrolase [Szabonella alba]
MFLTRRTFLTRSTALAATTALPGRLWAGTTLTMGDIRIDTLSDGNLVLPGGFVLDGAPDEATEVLASLGVPTDRFEPPCNLTLLRDGTNTVLFDAGSGPDFMPSAGKILEALEAAGLGPEEITHVIFTHAHPDHIWGLLDDFDEPVFPEADYMIGQAEYDYWTDPDTVNTIGEARMTFAVGAERRLAAIADRTAFLTDGQEALPGITARLTPGHTPGHMSFVIGAGSDAVMVLGDAIGNPHLAFARPEWPSGSDQDPETGRATRKALFDQIMAEDMPVIGFHLPEGGIGRVERADDGFRFNAGI